MRMKIKYIKSKEEHMKYTIEFLFFAMLLYKFVYMFDLYDIQKAFIIIFICRVIIEYWQSKITFK